LATVRTTALDQDVYRLLLDRHDLGVAGVAAELDVTLPAVRESLDRLAALALLHTASSGALQAVHPSVALPQMLDSEEQLLQRQREEIQARRAALTELVADFAEARSSPTSDVVTRVEDARDVRARLAVLAAEARTDVVSFTPPSRDGGRVARGASRPADLDLLDRGVAVRTLYELSLAQEPDAIVYAQRLQASGGDVRMVAALPLPMIVVDGQVGVLPLLGRAGAPGAVFVREPGTLQALRALFDAYWAVATPIALVVRSDSTCTTAEAAVLRLLASGAKDEAVARQLNVSVRTVRRHISAVMVRLNATSRFEAGVRAAALGWI